MNCEECGACCGHAGDHAVGKGSQGELTLDTACSAFRGTVGSACGCSIYEDRPNACREFEAGSMECLDTRRMSGL